MKRLYENLLCKGKDNNKMELDVYSALREAMIGMLRDGHHDIRDWAPLLVYVDPQLLLKINNIGTLIPIQRF